MRSSTELRVTWPNWPGERSGSPTSENPERSSPGGPATRGSGRVSLDLLSLSLPIAVMAFLVALGFSTLGQRVADQVWRRPRGGAAAAADAEVAPSTGVRAKRTQRARAVSA